VRGLPLVNGNWSVSGKGTAQLLLAAALLLLTSCGLLGGGQEVILGHQTELPPQSEAVLTCSQECADRGWCGTLPDQRTVIMGNAGNPVTDPRDTIFLQDTLVFINQVGPGTVELLATGEQSLLTFYQVTSFDVGKSAWIAGWCIAAP
jgi:hypothetical protein